MSRPPQYENEAYVADGATGTHGTGVGGEPEEVPMVFHPQAESTPPYEEYVDPAAAHGWQNAYDETRELPTVPVPELPPVPGGEPVAGSHAGPGRRRSRRKPVRWRSRRAVVAAGAAVAVSAAALIAGFAFSGSSDSSDGTQGKEGGTSSAPDDSTATGSPSDDSASSGSPEAGGTASTGADASQGVPPDAKESDVPSAAPSTAPAAPAATSTPTVTSTAPSGSAPGNSGGKGRGPGAIKKSR